MRKGREKRDLLRIKKYQKVPLLSRKINSGY